MPYLTPEPPDKIITLQAAIPDTLFPSFIGAWLDLWHVEHWEQYGTLTPDEVIDYIGTAFFTIEEFPQLPIGISGKSIKFLYVVSGGILLYLLDKDGSFLFVIGDI